MISVCLPVTPSNLAVYLSDESVIAHGPLCEHEAAPLLRFALVIMLPINTPVATTVSARPSKNGTRGPFASVLSEKFNLMAQDKDHSEIPE